MKDNEEVNHAICLNMGWTYIPPEVRDSVGSYEWIKPDGYKVVHTPRFRTDFEAGLDALVQTHLYFCLERNGRAPQFGKHEYTFKWLCRLEQVVPEARSTPPESKCFYFSDTEFGETPEEAIYNILLYRYGPKSDPKFRTPSDIPVSEEKRPPRVGKRKRF